MKKDYILVGICLSMILIILASFWSYCQKKKAFEKFSQMYDAGEYDEILLFYSGSHISEDYIFHNLGNTLVQQFVHNGNGAEKQTLEFALNFYSGALAVGENEMTRYNYERVKDYLNQKGEDEEKESKEQNGGASGENESESSPLQNQQSSASGSENTSESSSDHSEQEGSQKSDSGAVQSSRNQEYYLDENSTIDKLSEEDKQELEATIQDLKQEQVYNQQFYNTKDQGSEFDSLFDSFFGRIDRGGEKDW